MKKALLSIVALTLLINGADVRTMQEKAGITVTSSSGKTQETRTKDKVDDYSDSVIYHDLGDPRMDWHRSIKNRKKYGNAIPLNGRDKNIQALNSNAQRIASLNKELKVDNEQDNWQTKPIVGVCHIGSYRVFANEKVVNVSCPNVIMGDKKGSGILTVKLIPDFTGRSVVAIPLKINFNDNIYALKGIMTRQNGDTNIADYVDTKEIDILKKKGYITASDVIYKYTQGYLEARREAKTEQKVNFITVDDGNGGSKTIPVAEKKVESPKVFDYLAGATLDLVSSIAKAINEEELKNIKPLFIIRGKTLSFDAVAINDTKASMSVYDSIDTTTSKEQK